MRSISFMSLIIISTLILFFPLSSKCNPDEKNWLDRCDINRLKERPPEIPSATSLPYTTTTKKKGIFWWWKDKGFPLRPMAHEKEIFEILKEKLMGELRGRGLSEELDPWTNDARAFRDYNYDYEYQNHEGIPPYESHKSDYPK
ncbi:uncharacterized protein LOC123675522 isoform X3 [Harmonia axyridis]|uniref:uncharacterized protein LOC123675522 isoform X3 n=1 Tax=Harmonia axyridis TaxID=115357 RepID=UPI001E275E27|nr:uncharacterized protein LOC123675522 isoform X3 [Harmonia axyridis]